LAGTESGQVAERVLDRLVREVEVDYLTGLIAGVGGQVEQAVAAQGGQDDLLLTRLLAAQRLLDAGGQRVRRLGCRHNTLRPGKTKARREALRLWLGHGLKQAQLIHVRQQR